MSKRSKKRARKIRKIVYWTCVIGLVLVILVCLGLIAHKVITDVLSNKQYEELGELKSSASTDFTRPPVPTDPTGESGTQPTEDVTEPSATEPSEPDDGSPKILPQYQLMYDLNPDTVGWIELPGTRIDYPVVQTPDDPNFYLRRNFYKEYATCGTIYARAMCDVNKPSDNITLYGHNMSNGSMFADLHKFEEKSWWMDNRYIYFDTLYEYHTYEVFAVFVGTADLTIGFAYHLFDDAESEAEYNMFVENCKRLSLYDTGITPQPGDKLLTLSTCDKSQDEGRFVVVARRVV